MQAAERHMTERQRVTKMRVVHRAIPRLLDYLADYRKDRALVYTDLHRAAVDRIYQRDERISTWTAHWHRPSGTPYLVRGRQFVFLPDTTEAVRIIIESAHP